MKEGTTNIEGHQKIPWHILPVIIISQFAGTSLWFAGNAIAGDLIKANNLPDETIGYLTSSVQLGFIIGTLLFAFFTLADRISPVRLFALSSFLAAGVSYLAVFTDSLSLLLTTRFMTGFFLAGIYPVGMKISADWFGKSLGKALGYLVGALVLGTALPHLIRGYTSQLPWEEVLMLTSGIAAAGGILMLLTVKDGPFRKRSQGFELGVFTQIFKVRDFRRAAFGYFGHMWELYTVWAFIPVIIANYGNKIFDARQVSLWSFAIIATGMVGCIWGGYQSMRWSSSRVAMLSLIISGICCLVSPWIFYAPREVFIAVLFVWGFFVVSDSPQFSTIIARTAPPKYVGSALTIVNSIGFAITIPSIELLNYLLGNNQTWPLILLFIGPLFGIISIRPLASSRI